jgi:hypothetical protein
MTTQFAQGRPYERGKPDRTRTGGFSEAFFAAGTIVLAIIGLAAAPRAWGSVATIALGVAFVLERWTLAERAHEGGVTPGPEAKRGLTAESVAGWTGIVLGILALLRLAPTFLIPISVIVYGAGLALGSGVGTRSGRVLVGCAAIVLGVLALLRVDPRTLSLIGLLGMGATLLFSGPAMAYLPHRTAQHPAA